MAYKCLDCGHIFEEGEQAYWKEYQGQFHGEPAYEELCGCPLCRGCFEETKRCKVCCGDFLEEDLDEHGVCDDCVEDIVSSYKNNFVKCFNLSQKTKETQKVEIDYFLSCMFTPEQINEILFREIFAASCDSIVDCTNFIEADKSWFIDAALREVIK